MITVTGGKLTTFRIMAEEALQQASSRLPHPPNLSTRKRYFNGLPTLQEKGKLSTSDLDYLLGRYGIETEELLACSKEEENQHIGDLPNMWSEIRWAARTGAVEHLDDLLLRRVRLGMLLPDGASAEMYHIRSIAQSELGWNDLKWAKEEKRYREIYEKFYSSAPKGICGLIYYDRRDKMAKTKFVPSWYTQPTPAGTYRSLFKWGDPAGFKHPNSGAGETGTGYLPSGKRISHKTTGFCPRHGS